MGFASVAHRVVHRLPRPVVCDYCGGPNVALQKRELLKLKTYGKWDLVWHCGDCGALVGCHEGTDIPLGKMASAQTRKARFEAHKAFDRLWAGKAAVMNRRTAYAWMASTLALSVEQAHISMLDEEQCYRLIEAVEQYRHHQRHAKHWTQKKRKKRR